MNLQTLQCQNESGLSKHPTPENETLHLKTHCDKSIAQCQVISLANRPKKLSEEASLQRVET